MADGEGSNLDAAHTAYSSRPQWFAQRRSDNRLQCLTGATARQYRDVGVAPAEELQAAHVIAVLVSNQHRCQRCRLDPAVRQRGTKASHPDAGIDEQPGGAEGHEQRIARRATGQRPHGHVHANRPFPASTPSPIPMPPSCAIAHPRQATQACAAACGPAAARHADFRRPGPGREPAYRSLPTEAAQRTCRTRARASLSHAAGASHHARPAPDADRFTSRQRARPGTQPPATPPGPPPRSRRGRGCPAHLRPQKNRRRFGASARV